MIIKANLYKDSPQYQLEGKPFWWGRVSFLLHHRGVDVYWYKHDIKALLVYVKSTHRSNYIKIDFDNLDVRDKELLCSFMEQPHIKEQWNRFSA